MRERAPAPVVTYSAFVDPSADSVDPRLARNLKLGGGCYSLGVRDLSRSRMLRDYVETLRLAAIVELTNVAGACPARRRSVEIGRVRLAGLSPAEASGPRGYLIH